jgi:hypothetical protein
MDTNKVSLFASFLMALPIASCKGDRTAQNAIFINQFANPQNGPPAGNTGDIRIDNSVIRNNPGGSWYPLYPGISIKSDTKCVVTNSIIE